MNKTVLGIMIGIVIWVPINCILYYNRTGSITLDAIWVQSKPALLGVLSLALIYFIIRKVKK